jgi:hypothetical protein
MITELTKEQEAMLPVYRAKWKAISTDSTPFTQAEAEDIIHAYQKYVLGVKETPVIVCDSPISAWDKVVEVTQLPEGDRDFIYPFQDGSFFSYMFSYYDFFVAEKLVPVDAELKQKLDAWFATSKLGLIYPLDDVCVVSQKPNQIHVDERGRLHCENGPAIEYPGYKLFSLNGITVPEYLVMTASEDLTMEFFKAEKNADVKAEFVRKYGVERMLDLGKKVDSFENYDQEEQPWWWKSEYELHDMAVLFEGLEYQPYLKMKNQTTGIWHVEAVSPACTTLPLAIKERFGGKDMRIVAIA